MLKGSLFIPGQNALGTEFAANYPARDTHGGLGVHTGTSQQGKAMKNPQNLSYFCPVPPVPRLETPAGLGDSAERAGGARGHPAVPCSPPKPWTLSQPLQDGAAWLLKTSPFGWTGEGPSPLCLYARPYAAPASVSLSAITLTSASQGQGLIQGLSRTDGEGSPVTDLPDPSWTPSPSHSSSKTKVHESSC